MIFQTKQEKTQNASPLYEFNDTQMSLLGMNFGFTSCSVLQEDWKRAYFYLIQNRMSH